MPRRSRGVGPGAPSKWCEWSPCIVTLFFRCGTSFATVKGCPRTDGPTAPSPLPFSDPFPVTRFLPAPTDTPDDALRIVLDRASAASRRSTFGFSGSNASCFSRSSPAASLASSSSGSYSSGSSCSWRNFLRTRRRKVFQRRYCGGSGGDGGGHGVRQVQVRRRRGQPGRWEQKVGGAGGGRAGAWAARTIVRAMWKTNQVPLMTMLLMRLNSSRSSECGLPVMPALLMFCTATTPWGERRGGEGEPSRLSGGPDAWWSLAARGRQGRRRTRKLKQRIV